MMKFKDWNIEAMTGYKPQTTFYLDFSIADAYGTDAIIDTYKRSFKMWGHNHEYLTELVMALNWKIWEHYETNPLYGDLYNKLWMEADAYAKENLKGEELAYFYRTTD